MKPRSVILLLALLVIPSVVFAVSVGSADISFVQAWREIFRAMTEPDSLVASPDTTIVVNLRLPRVLAALIVGGGLSVVGVAMQALVRNPLAEPYILGISGGASAGASLFFMGYLPAVLAGMLSMSLAAFLGALLSITLVYLVARSGRTLSVSRLLLAGVAMSALMAAISSFAVLASDDPDRMRTVLFWLMGSLSDITWGHLPLAGAAALGGAAALFIMSRFLDAFLVGEEPAHSLGVRVEAVKKTLIVLAAFVTGTLVSISGAIGFVGLIVPHIVRGFVGVSHRYVIPAAFFLGGLFLLAADVLAQWILPGQELPIGIVTAVAGVPFFLFMLRRSDYEYR